MAEQINLENLGNFPPNYQNEPRISIPGEPIITPQLALKWYEMIKPKDGLFNRNQVKKVRDFLEGQINLRDIEVLSGLGFVILSGNVDFLNVAVWDKSIPYLLKNKVYDNYKEVDIRKEGAFCMWELGIVAHEARAWKKYLESVRTESDKLSYLADITGGKF